MSRFTEENYRAWRKQLRECYETRKQQLLADHARDMETLNQIFTAFDVKVENLADQEPKPIVMGQRNRPVAKPVPKKRPQPRVKIPREEVLRAVKQLGRAEMSPLTAALNRIGLNVSSKMVGKLVRELVQKGQLRVVAGGGRGFPLVVEYVSIPADADGPLPIYQPQSGAPVDVEMFG